MYACGKKWFLHNNSSIFWDIMMILHICIVNDPRKRHFDFGFKGLEFELYIYFFGGGGDNVKCKGQICDLHIAKFLHNNYITFWHDIVMIPSLLLSRRRHFFGQKVKIIMLKFAFGTLHHFHTQNEVSLLYFDIQWCNFTYDAMFSMTSGVPLLTSKTQTKENMNSLIFYHPKVGGGGL